jgi:hypothetical protein
MIALSQSIIDMIVAEYRDRASLKTIAGMYFMSPGTVRKILISEGVTIRPSKSNKAGRQA